METLVAEAQRFLRALNADNTRAWWLAHKAEYDAKLKAPALALLEGLTPALGSLAGAPVTGKLFRPYNDVRFAKGKPLYKTHLHMMWQMQDDDAKQAPVFFFGIDLDRVTVGAGLMAFEKDMLADWRLFADQDHKRMNGVVKQVEDAGFDLWEPTLKRVPSPHPADHPAARLLRMKGCVASGPLPDGPLEKRIMAAFSDLQPLNALLLSIASA